MTSYAPFPADLLYPSPGQIVVVTGTSLTLTWSGSDPDNDIVRYDIYFGDAQQPPLFKSAAIAQQIDVQVSSGNTYYWKIVTYDTKGNQSDSGVYQFKVK